MPKSSIDPPTRRSTDGVPKRRPSTKPANPRQASSESSSRWTFLTNHSHVLILLAQDPFMVLRAVATRVGITERAVQKIIADLEEGGYIEREKVGRKNQYRVHRDKPLRHPIEQHRTIGALLSLICADS